MGRKRTDNRSLSNRQRQCLAYIAAGYTVQALAHALGISDRTAHYHVSSAKKKIGAATRDQAVLIATTSNLLTSSQPEEQDQME